MRQLTQDCPMCGAGREVPVKALGYRCHACNAWVSVRLPTPVTVPDSEMTGYEKAEEYRQISAELVEEWKSQGWYPKWYQPL